MYAFFTAHYSIVPICIFAFIAAHAVGQGVTIWVYIAEIFPNQQRAKGQALGSFTHWIFAAILTTLFPKVVAAFPPGYVFLFFAGMMVLQLIWVKRKSLKRRACRSNRFRNGLESRWAPLRRRIPRRRLCTDPSGPLILDR